MNTCTAKLTRTHKIQEMKGKKRKIQASFSARDFVCSFVLSFSFFFFECRTDWPGFLILCEPICACIVVNTDNLSKRKTQTTSSPSASCLLPCSGARLHQGRRCTCRSRCPCPCPCPMIAKGAPRPTQPHTLPWLSPPRLLLLVAATVAVPTPSLVLSLLLLFLFLLLPNSSSGVRPRPLGSSPSHPKGLVMGTIITIITFHFLLPLALAVQWTFPKKRGPQFLLVI